MNAHIAALRKRLDAPVVPGSNAHLVKLQGELADYFAGSLRRFSVPLSYRGTTFQQRVWEQLLAIPYGETRSYEQLAIATGNPKAVRAVGHANGLNRICILIPCHRVINKDGRLGGYGGGLRRKQYLLEHERANLGELV
ncbi:MAG: methylated-DNA--[protein]-cysteine S-methyltransferase [Gammaproteobacteria bacterium]|nr:methylated-DNA--[protein]-cysteine S-methyltransferase [Gammaproteobacteria bacterium]MBA3731935.1 methylated-DNA--[protein]-cysteine S-methyltransferase [Gammaproteobacteria bacterium]